MYALLLFTGWLLGLLTVYAYRVFGTWMRNTHKSTVQGDEDEEIPEGSPVVMVGGKVVRLSPNVIGNSETVTVARMGEDGKPGEFRTVRIPKDG